MKYIIKTHCKANNPNHSKQERTNTALHTDYFTSLSTDTSFLFRPPAGSLSGATQRQRWESSFQGNSSAKVSAPAAAQVSVEPGKNGGASDQRLLRPRERRWHRRCSATATAPAKGSGAQGSQPLAQGGREAARPPGSADPRAAELVVAAPGPPAWVRPAAAPAPLPSSPFPTRQARSGPGQEETQGEAGPLGGGAAATWQRPRGSRSALAARTLALVPLLPQRAPVHRRPARRRQPAPLPLRRTR